MSQNQRGEEGATWGPGAPGDSVPFSLGLLRLLSSTPDFEIWGLQADRVNTWSDVTWDVCICVCLCLQVKRPVPFVLPK